jgi:GxxExxY protein
MPKRNWVEDLIQLAFDHGMAIHRAIGPGLLESVYERVLADRLSLAGVKVDRQQPINIVVEGVSYADAFRYDLLLDDMLIIEIKSIERLGPIHHKQTLTYIRLMNLPYGLVLNFGTAMFRNGMRRVINDRYVW